MALAACVRTEVGTTPEVEGVEPVIRVGIAAPDGAVTIGGGSAVLLAGADGGGLTPIEPGATVQLVGSGGRVTARAGAAGSASTWTARVTDSSGFVRVNGRDYRGTVAVSGGRTGLLVINELPLEAYVAGVVNAEMGRRPASDQAALYAQAVLSRTFALRAIGRYRVRGYDVLNTVADQAYGGVLAESDPGWEAVHATRGQVVTYDDQLAEVYFHSTCGGRTVAVEEGFSGTPVPHLKSILDQAPDGSVYCAISPRFRWSEEWGGNQLSQTLRQTLPLVGGDPAIAGAVSDVQITMRSATNRVAELVVAGGGRTATVRGQQMVRTLLRTADSPLLRSAAFSVVVSREGGRIVRLRADGGGAGHGVGMCQWGAIGRSRAGASYRDIIGAYFPGVEVRRSY